jgi:hypothetical protein
MHASTNPLLDSPVLLFVVSLVALAAAAWLGTAIARRLHALGRTSREDFNLVLASTLTLLGLIIGFSFSMALSRYDKRVELEATEANAIGTAALRARLLGPTEAALLRPLLRQYVAERIAYYGARADQLEAIDASTTRLHVAMWDVVRGAAAAQPNPITAIVAESFNDAINGEGYVQAAWGDRIPLAAWALMGAMALISAALTGFMTQHKNGSRWLMLVLPLIIALAFQLIADIESPRTGFILVDSANLTAVEQLLRTP